MPPRFTVLLPVHRPPALLPYAIETVLAQTHANFELFVICDGAPTETAACAQAFADRDARVRVFNFAKGERHGESHRHTALATATGDCVAAIADDDLWFSGHLSALAALLQDADFGNLVQTEVLANGKIHVRTSDLADPQTRRRMMEERWNFFGLSAGGYRMSAYRRLPDGWTPAPPDMWSDLYMWRKFLALDGATFGTQFEIQVLRFSAPSRREMSMEDRIAETRSWFERLRDPSSAVSARAEILKQLCAELESARSQAAALGKSQAKLRSYIEALTLRNAALQAELAAIAAQRGSADA